MTPSIQDTHKLDVPEFVEDSNTSNNPEFATLIDRQLSRRNVLKGGAGLTTLAFFGQFGLTGCANTAQHNTKSSSELITRPSALKFTPVPHSTAEDILVADGYTAEPILHLGTPLISGLEDFRDDRMTVGESFAYRMGDNHDGMWFFGMTNGKYDPNQSERALLVMNHEYTNATLHPTVSNMATNKHGFSVTKQPNAPKLFQEIRLATDVRRDMYCHGVSVVELKRRANGQGYEMVKDSRFNKRYHSLSKTRLSGAVAGHPLVRTKFDNTGMSTFGINNECGAGLSPWGTYLTTEENFLNVFARGEDKAIIGDKADFALARYGLKQNSLGDEYLWHTPNATEEKITDEFARWNATATASTPNEDYRHAFNSFGYIVEIDPFNPSETAVKRTNLGRFAHENCAFAPARAGKPIVFYMGDDARGEYIYKFVSKALWQDSDIGKGLAVGDKYMNEGTLYVAVFHEDGTGEWRELSYGKNGLDNTNATYPFSDQADVLIHARIAGDVVGATKMDRPEWVSVSPVTNEIYVTLTNNSKRGSTHELNAANPRNYDGQGETHIDNGGKTNTANKGNSHGHIIRFKEADNDHRALQFEWDIYLFAAPSTMPRQNLSALTASNDLSSPDGLFFDPRGVLWIQTDDGAYTDTTNCMLLAALPGKVGDGDTITTTANQITHRGAVMSEDTLRRFFVGPKGCEVTGITLTPDFKTLFINIQHPEGSWGAVAGGRTPRSATVMITKNDGGVILGESFG